MSGEEEGTARLGPTVTRELAHQLRAGDEAVFQELYERVAPALYAWTELRIRRSPNVGLDSEDVLQEVWLRALRGLDSFDEARSFRGWILGIAKNVLLQRYEKTSRDQVLDRDPSSTGSTWCNLPDTATSISVRVARDEGLQ